MNDLTVKIRVPTKDLHNWKHGARLAGIPLSEWIRRKCNGEAITTAPIEAVREVSEKVATSEGRKAIKACTHGTARGYHCWQCKGIAEA